MDTENIFDLLKKYWLALLLATILAILLFVFRTQLGISWNFRTVVILTVTTGLLIGAPKVFTDAADRAILREDARQRANPQPNQPDIGDAGVKYIVALDSVIFILVGLAAAMVTCNRSALVLPLAGSCLLIGGFFGLLFGYPQGAAQQGATNPPGGSQAITNAQGGGQGGANAQESGQTGTKAASQQSKNLVAESAATLGKVIAGFSLAKAGPAIQRYSTLCEKIGPALANASVKSDTDTVVAGVIMAYFLATGFVSGLLLPPYFMSKTL